MKIGILGTRGIPNYHGGFEQFAEFFASFLVKKNHEVYVYCSGSHPHQEKTFNGAHLIHCKDPEDKIGTVGQFFYDLNCIRDSRKRDFDILLQLGYTSNSVWSFLLPKKSIIVTNMDGLEWKRSKYNKYVQRFLKLAEKWAVKSSEHLIADSLGIQNYLNRTYQRDSKFIAYGAEAFNTPSNETIKKYQVKEESYNLLIARMEPENNIETILDGAVASKNKTPFLVVGKHDNGFGTYLKDKYKDQDFIRFLGGIYNLEDLNNLRYYSKLYFHGHSVGGTNPSLLEAMASNTLIVANKNEFNETILGEDAFYFNNAQEVTSIIDHKEDKSLYLDKINNNLIKINKQYTWERINQQYLDFFLEAYEQN
mgnify:CR=1 FL=1